MLRFDHAPSVAANLLQAAICCEYATTVQPLTDPPSIGTNEGDFTPWLSLPAVAGNRLRTLIWRRDMKAIVALAGLPTSNELAGFIAGAREPGNLRATVGRVNAMTIRHIEEVYDAMVTSALPFPTTLYIFGHSAGGAAAHGLAAATKARRPANNVRCSTFGAPRFADDTFHNIHGQRCDARVMNYGDGYVKMLPHSNESVTFAVLSSPRHLATTNAMVHGPNGLTIDAAGNVLEGSLPTGISVSPTWDIMQAWISNVRSGANPHSITQYVAALAVRSIATPTAPLRLPAVDYPAEVEPPRLTHREAAVAASAYLAAAAVPYQERIPARPSAIRTQHSGSQWYVTLHGTIIYTASSRRDALGAANALRAIYLQYWQRPFAWTGSSLLGQTLFADVDMARPSQGQST